MNRERAHRALDAIIDRAAARDSNDDMRCPYCQEPTYVVNGRIARHTAILNGKKAFCPETSKPVTKSMFSPSDNYPVALKYRNMSNAVNEELSKMKPIRGWRGGQG
jgi:hypothetical protein